MCGIWVADHSVTSPVGPTCARRPRGSIAFGIRRGWKYRRVTTHVRGVDRRLHVVRLELPDVALVGSEIGVNERSAVLERLLDVGDRVQRLVVHFDELGRVLRERARLGHDDRDAVALEAGLLGRQRKVRRHLDVLGDRPGTRHAARPVAGQVGAAERRNDALGRARSVEVHALDPCMWIRTADEHHGHGAGQREVVHVRSPSEQERCVLLALDGRADGGFGCFHDGHVSSPRPQPGRP